ncbi:hypothetical protein GURASL_31220 [Geotalea uraniireducens]|uniref:Uncharacterized protein n=1 Tax=Geotalea uraniireducens TaxID=351604 RepID=A0ABN6VV36_9BACT|nr:hypothetical protein [Geotalea uraniireducens]BDV44199.1 hypothetical protein GURASL_31220 [Geotalea uraniireducens]
MTELKFRTDEIPKIIGIAEKLSTISEFPTGSTSRALHAEEIFNKLILHIASFRKHLASNNKETGHVDISVLAALARMVIETHNALCYFCDASASKDELDFRIWLYHLHYSCDLRNILSCFNFTDHDSIMSTFEMTGRMSVSCLERNVFFTNLTEKEQRQLLLGRKAFYWRGRRPKKSPFSKEMEEGVYKLLSNYVHSFPLGNIMYRGGGSANHLNFYNSAFLIVEVFVSYSAAATLTYCRLRRKLGTRITTEEKAYLNDMATDVPIKEWLSQRKEIGINNNVLYFATNDDI